MTIKIAKVKYEIINLDLKVTVISDITKVYVQKYHSVSLTISFYGFFF